MEDLEKQRKIHSERLAFEGSGSGVLRLRAECKMHMQAEVGCNSVPQSSNIAAHSLVHAPRKRNATPAGCIWWRVAAPYSSLQQAMEQAAQLPRERDWSLSVWGPGARYKCTHVLK